MAEVKTLIYFLYSITRFYLLTLRVNKIFFFPFYHTGGAERVHLDIVKTTGKKNAVTIFTSHSANDHFYKEFEKYSHVVNFTPYVNHRYYRALLLFVFRFVGLFNPITTFGCNSSFYYEVLPFLRKRIRKVDLLHAFSYPKAGMEVLSLPYVQYLDRRIVINQKTKQDYLELYKNHNIPGHFINRIEVISNMVEIPDFEPKNNFDRPLNVLYFGRVSFEKRVHLVVKIGKKLPENCELKIIGPLEMKVVEINRFYKGSITDHHKMEEVYKSTDILLITSFREGFPMVVMEAMARGVLCICTDVGGIAEHIVNAQNGFLVENYPNEDEIVAAFLKIIMQVEGDRALLAKLAQNSYDYARKNFGKEAFIGHYQQVLN